MIGRFRKRYAVPTGILLFGLLGLALLVRTRPAPKTREIHAPPPVLRVVPAVSRVVQLRVRTQGTVIPRTQSELVPEVSGSIVWVSPAFVSGGFFEPREALLRIDPRDYQVELEQARASLARRTSEHARTKKELVRTRELSSRHVVSQARLEDAENAERVAAAELRVAQAVLARAERDLERTTIRAPYTGRVREEQVGVGQFVDRGKPIATLYAVDYAEVRLPLPDDQLAFLDIQLHQGVIDPEQQPRVRLRAVFAGTLHEWEGRIVRTEGEIDSASRMVHVIARIPDPYGRQLSEKGNPSQRPPLAVGLFVKAEIFGRTLPHVFVLPRSALRNDAEVVVVDRSNRLHRRHVEVVRTEHEAVLITGGLGEGERVVVSTPEIVVEGMEVRTTSEPSGTESGLPDSDS